MPPRLKISPLFRLLLLLLSACLSRFWGWVRRLTRARSQRRTASWPRRSTRIKGAIPRSSRPSQRRTRCVPAAAAVAPVVVVGLPSVRMCEHSAMRQMFALVVEGRRSSCLFCSGERRRTEKKHSHPLFAKPTPAYSFVRSLQPSEAGGPSCKVDVDIMMVSQDLG